MRTIKVKDIIENSGLAIQEVAEQLFPNNKFPRLALNRVMTGESILNSDQVSKLSLLTGIPIEKLYSGNSWEAKYVGHTHVFNTEEFRAELDTQTWVTKIFHKDSLFHESVIHSGSTPLSVYFKELDSIINNFKNKKQ